MLQALLSIKNRDVRLVSLFTFLLLAVLGQPARAQTYTVLHAFTATPDGANPNPILLSPDGNIYGTTGGGGLASCGQGSCGTVFKIDSAGNETVLFQFPGGNSGSNPMAAVIQDPAGNLYGTTQGNGFIGAESVIFKLDPQGNETVLQVLPTPDVCCLDAPLVRDAGGNFYGMSPYAGTCTYSELGCGSLFKVDASGALTVLHVFNGKDGLEPEGGLVLDSAGNLYGAATGGGNLKCLSLGYGHNELGCGTIYKLDPRGKFTVLHKFKGKGDGSVPLGLIIDNAGNLYGIALSGGDEIKGQYPYGLGTVFEVDASGHFHVLFTFTPAITKADGYANLLVRDSNGNLYGAKQYNGANGTGCLFRIDPQGNYTDLFDFQGEGEGQDGFFPMGVVPGPNGDFYGSMLMGGLSEHDCQAGCGTVFHLTFP
jgi:uncharacterized repeat protein (TIGR03803 family)